LEGLLDEALDLPLLQAPFLFVHSRCICSVAVPCILTESFTASLPGSCHIDGAFKGDVAEEQEDLIGADVVISIKVEPTLRYNRLVWFRCTKGWEDLHFEGQAHFCFDAAAVDLEHELIERLLEDAAVGVALAGEGVEPVTDNAGEIDILNERHLVDALCVGGGLGGPQG